MLTERAGVIVSDFVRELVSGAGAGEAEAVLVQGVSRYVERVIQESASRSRAEERRRRRAEDSSGTSSPSDESEVERERYRVDVTTELAADIEEQLIPLQDAFADPVREFVENLVGGAMQDSLAHQRWAQSAAERMVGGLEGTISHAQELKRSARERGRKEVVAAGEEEEWRVRVVREEEEEGDQLGLGAYIGEEERTEIRHVDLPGGKVEPPTEVIVQTMGDVVQIEEVEESSSSSSSADVAEDADTQGAQAVVRELVQDLLQRELERDEEVLRVKAEYEDAQAREAEERRERFVETLVGELQDADSTVQAEGAQTTVAQNIEETVKQWTANLAQQSLQTSAQKVRDQESAPLKSLIRDFVFDLNATVIREQLVGEDARAARAERTAELSERFADEVVDEMVFSSFSERPTSSTSSSELRSRVAERMLEEEAVATFVHSVVELERGKWVKHKPHTLTPRPYVSWPRAVILVSPRPTHFFSPCD